ncbi:MAG: 23S rRNA (adenine(2503)-C(2))-methyltransferase RlmN, partial [Verrucomicrobiia bacterium]
SDRGEPRYRAGQILDWIYRKKQRDATQFLNLPASLRTRLIEEVDWRVPELELEKVSRDTTRKLLLRLKDNRRIETVLIPASRALYGEASDRRTLCVSTQVGCAYGCRFCASGLLGFSRNLQAAEIVAQVLLAEQHTGERIDNLVFMGMGEPLANLTNLRRAIQILNAPWGVGIGARHITISTIGLAPQIHELAKDPIQIRLAISLHGATDEVRGKIMPINQRYNLATLMEACSAFRARHKQTLTFEFILIAGLNDSVDQADHLATLAQRLRAKVNLIPYNKVEGLSWQRPEEAVCSRFQARLKRRGVAATLRTEKGHDIDAACGQLRLKKELEGLPVGS